MAPGLDERSTAYLGQVLWASLNKTIRILGEKKKDLTAAKSHHRKLDKTN